MKKHGFTQIEVVSVLAVAGVLTTALVPAFAQFGFFGRRRANAQRTRCQLNLREVALGVRQYSEDYDEKFPLAASGANAFGYGWADCLQPYVKSIKVYQCPSEKHKGSSAPTRAGYTDYWYNRNLSGINESALDYPAYTLLAGDGDGGYKASNSRYALNSLPRAWVSTAGSPARRHLDGGNYTFIDGHVKWFVPHRITTTSPSAGAGQATFRVK